MAEYINREELIAACQKTHYAVNANDHPYDVVARVGKYFRRCVDEAPAADVAPKSEVASAIFADIEDNSKLLFDGVRNIVVLTETDFAELKKKYTEEKVK